MSGLTQAPWIIDEEGNRILGSDDRTTIVCHMSGTVRNPEIMADARLISAAPELLEALNRFLNDAYDYGMEYEHPCRVKARAAIAKALGETADDD